MTRETHEIDDPVEVLEPALLEHARRHVVLEVPVIEPEPQAVEPHAREEARVVGAEEVLEEAVEEEVVPLLPEGLVHCRAVLGLMAGEARDEVLHAGLWLEGSDEERGEGLHPAAEAGAAEDDGVASLVDNAGALDS
jgi:hypothetical protein